MKNNRTYEVNFDNGYIAKTWSLSDARKMVKENMYNAKVVSIWSTYLDKNSNLRKDKISF